MSNLISIARNAAIRHGIDPDVFETQFWWESRYRIHAVSNANAQGPAQIIPSTQKAWGVKNPYNPHEAFEAAAREEGKALKTYKKQGHDFWTSHKLMLGFYNAGGGAVAKYKGLPPYRETQKYAHGIIAGAKHKKVKRQLELAEARRAE